jgi:DNA-binding transcriptional LysR family regulator
LLSCFEIAPLTDPISTSRLASALTCNNMEALRAAAVGGFGSAYMLDFLARDDVARGGLETMLDNYLVDAGQFSIPWPSSRRLSSKLRAFRGFLQPAALYMTAQRRASAEPETHG